MLTVPSQVSSLTRTLSLTRAITRFSTTRRRPTIISPRPLQLMRHHLQLKPRPRVQHRTRLIRRHLSHLRPRVSLIKFRPVQYTSLRNRNQSLIINHNRPRRPTQAQTIRRQHHTRTTHRNRRTIITGITPRLQRIQPIRKPNIRIRRHVTIRSSLTRRTRNRPQNHTTLHRSQRRTIRITPIQRMTQTTHRTRRIRSQRHSRNTARHHQINIVSRPPRSLSTIRLITIRTNHRTRAKTKLNTVSSGSQHLSNNTVRTLTGLPPHINPRTEFSRNVRRHSQLKP